MQPKRSSASLPVVAIVGRPNVGKSALFNRFLGQRRAVVEDLPGTTRDRVYGDMNWLKRDFRIVDTGGLEAVDSGQFSALIRRQVKNALAEAEVILFVVDAETGVTPADEEVAETLRPGKAPIILVANKADNNARREGVTEFYELGMGEPWPISALHDRGIGELLDEVVTLLPTSQEPPEPETAHMAIAIIGRPNVGKSTLLNTITREERAIVSEVPGTTRDAIDMVVEHEGRQIRLIDTAGVRRRGRVDPGVELHSVFRTEDAIERSDVAILLLDGPEGVTAQDTHIAGNVATATKGLVVAVNKWDAMPEAMTWQEYAPIVLRRLRFAPWAAVCHISARTGAGVDELLRLVAAAREARRQRVPTGELNRAVQRAVALHSPSHIKGRRLRILYATQASIDPPTFVFFVNDATLVHFSYRRYLENALRAAFGFQGTAIKLLFRNRAEDEDRES